jgi:AmmeMemoRadiSam system protein B
MWNRQPVYAGQFYAADKDELKKEMSYYLKYAELPAIAGAPLAVIVPHAAHYFSGPVAAYSYNLLAGQKPEVVIVLAPSHRSTFLGASYIDEGSYETPLGSVPIDEKITQILMRRPNFFFIKEVHENEHSLEVQVPFLQQVLGDFSLVPLIIGTTEDRTMKKIGESLADIIASDERKVGLVISTDLSHYHKYDEARHIDNRFIDALLEIDESKLRRMVETREAEACGIGPIVIGLIACKKLGANKILPLKYATSGDTRGDKEQVVGYLSAAIVKE